MAGQRPRRCAVRPVPALGFRDPDRSTLTGPAVRAPVAAGGFTVPRW
ncbi:hypothetical protein [Actinophytocola sp. NPDC049390]